MTRIQLKLVTNHFPLYPEQRPEAFRWVTQDGFRKKIGKRVVGKNEKLERIERSWKESSEVGKNRAKLERTERNWKIHNQTSQWLKFAEEGQHFDAK